MQPAKPFLIRDSRLSRLGDWATVHEIAIALGVSSTRAELEPSTSCRCCKASVYTSAAGRGFSR